MIKFFKTYLVLALMLCCVTQSVGQRKPKEKKKAISKEIASFSFDNDQDRKQFDHHYFLAQGYKQNEEWGDEIKSLEACLEITDQVSAIYFELAKAYKSKDNTDESIRYLKTALELDSKNIWYLKALAEDYRSKFMFEEEVKLRAQILEAKPSDQIYRLEYTESLQLNSENKKAIEQLNILERNYGIQPEYSYQKHKLYMALKNWRSAENEIHKLIIEFPTEHRFKLALADYYILQKDMVKAKNVYETLLIKHPGLGVAELGLFNYYFENNDLKSAEKYLKSALKSGDLTAAQHLGIIEFAYGQYQQNLRSKENLKDLLEISVKAYPEQFEYYGYLGDLVPAHKYEEKAGYYKKALKLNPQFALYNVICEVYFLNSDYDSTIVWTEKTIEEFEYRPEPYLLLGYSYYYKENYKKAIAAAESGLDYLLENETAKIPFHAIIGTASNSAKDFKRSDKAYLALLKIDPENDEALNNYSYFLSVREEQLEQAEIYIKNVIKRQPNNATFLDTYGWVLFKLNKYKESKIQLEKAIKLSANPSSEMYEHLGDCYLALNKPKDALIQWRKALELLKGEGSDSLESKIKTHE